MLTHRIRAVLFAAVLIAAVACRKADLPDVAASVSADGVAAAPPLQPLRPAAVKSAPLPQHDSQLWGWSGLAHAASATAVDVLVRAGSPGQSAAEIDASAMRLIPVLQHITGVQRVVSWANAGELRILVRFGPTPLDAAREAVATACQTRQDPELAIVAIAAIQRGNRARLAWALTSDRGDLAATAVGEALHPALAKQLPTIASFVLTGAVRPVIFTDVLTKTVADKQLIFADVVSGLRAFLAQNQGRPPQTDEAAAAGELGAALGTTAITGSQAPQGATTLRDLVAIRRGVGEPGRAAWVGRNAVPVLVAEQGVSGSVDQLAGQEAAWRRDPATKAALGDTTVHPQTVEAAYRFVLQQADQAGEPGAELAKRLLAVREIPAIVAVLAVQGADGIPFGLTGGTDATAWTVWVSLSSAGATGEVALRSATALLAAGPWQVAAIPSNLDTGLAWVSGVSGSAGCVVWAADAALVQTGTQAIGQALVSRTSVINVRTGPQAMPLAAQAGRWRPGAGRTAGLPVADRQLLASLLQAPQLLGYFAGRSVWLDLPHGVMQAEQGGMPVQAPRPGPDRQITKLDDLLQPPPPGETTARLRVDGQAALFLAADSASSTPGAAASTFRDAVERNGRAGAVQFLSLTLVDPLTGGESCVP